MAGTPAFQAGSLRAGNMRSRLSFRPAARRAGATRKTASVGAAGEAGRPPQRARKYLIILIFFVDPAASRLFPDRYARYPT
jgi:hypothetical protein